MPASSIHNGFYADRANCRLDIYYDGTRVVQLNDCGMSLIVGGGIVSSGNALTINDDLLLNFGTGADARFSWDTTDVNAEALLLQLPAGSGTVVPVLVIGELIESVDLALYNGKVDPVVALQSVGARTTAASLEFRTSRGSSTSPSGVTTGDDLGSIDVFGRGTNTYRQTHRILFDSGGTIGNDRVPSTMVFQTATDACPSVLTTALTLGANQVATFPLGPIVTAGDFEAVLGTLHVQDGGAVTQCTNKSTTVILNTWAGQITTNSACLAAGVEVTFRVTNSRVGLQDIPVLAIQSGGTPGEYILGVSRVTACDFDVTITNASGSNAADVIIINYAIIKGAVS